MREKKRLEHLLATDADLGRRGDDIAAYFELAKEGENVEGELRRDIDSLRELVDKLETETLLSGENDAAECDCHDSSRRGGNGIAGLGRHAAAHVSALGGAAGI